MGWTEDHVGFALTVFLFCSLIVAGILFLPALGFFPAFTGLGIALIVSGIIICCCGIPPLIIECCLACCGTRKGIQKRWKKVSRELAANPKLLPIVYREEYNITAFGLEKYHPFDSTKYRNIINHLLEANFLTPDLDVISPLRASHHELRMIHPFWYLLKLHSTFYQMGILEIPMVAPLPSFLARARVFVPMQYQTGGTVEAAFASIVRGWAINLGGGFHHAHYGGGGGFCPYADITLAVKALRETFPDRIKRVMIIDLDAHQGNGHERDFLGDLDTYIFDMYNPGIYPNDRKAMRGIHKDIHVTWSTSYDNSYLSLLQDGLTDAFANFAPDFILYNAGTDCMDSDPLGNLQLSPEGIIKRDEMVFQVALQRKIPIAMVLSGGYQSKTARVIAKSIINLNKKLGLISRANQTKLFVETSSSS